MSKKDVTKFRMGQEEDELTHEHKPSRTLQRDGGAVMWRRVYQTEYLGWGLGGKSPTEGLRVPYVYKTILQNHFHVGRR